MAKFSTLTDNFNDNSLSGSKWFSYTGGTSTLTEQNSRLECALPSSAGASDIAGIGNQSPKDLTASYVLVQIVQAVSASTNATMSMHAYDDAAGAGTANTNSVLWTLQNGTLYAQKYVAGVKTTIGSFSFVLATHKWWRIREASGTVYWDTSTDGLTWTNQYSNAPGITLTSANVDLECGCFQAETNPGTGIFDNFNLLTQQISGTGVASVEAFGTAQVGRDETITTTGIASAETFGTPSLVYEKLIYPDGFDAGEIGTPAITLALLTSTAYDAVAKPTTAYGNVAKPTTPHTAVAKPTTAYSSEVL